MSPPATVVLRRTWPQRLVITATLAVIGAALASAWFLNDVYVAVASVGRVEISGEVLFTDTAPGEPVNFLLIGEDSALGLPADDPATFFREVDPRGRFQADSISVVRVNPTSGQAWVMSVPRDLLVDVRGSDERINATLLIEGPELLVETVSENFGIPINHYITLDFLGFRRVVDELDGVPVWFDNPARDLRTGLDISVAGCHVLSGVQSLQYVRARSGYEEFIDDRWTTVGNADFGRIERQQDFLVLALERAISRGARNPATLAALVEAGATSVTLDSELTIAELVDIGEAFSDFNPENLERLGLAVTTDNTGGVYQGERLIPGANDAIFEIFRGSADLPANDEIRFDVYADGDIVASAATQLANLGFEVADRFALDVDAVDGLGDETVVIHHPDDLAAAQSIARWLEPIPRLVEDDSAASISVVLGTGYEQVLFLYPHEVPKMREAVDEQDDTSLPDLSGATRVDDASADGETVDSEPVETTSTTVTTTTNPPTTTSAVPAEAEPDSDGIIGRAPEGQNCG